MIIKFESEEVKEIVKTHVSATLGIIIADKEVFVSGPYGDYEVKITELPSDNQEGSHGK